MEDLERLYEHMAVMTQPLCASGSEECVQFHGRPYRCCSREYCEKAEEFAKEKYGIELQRTGNPELPFMSPSGCTVLPHLRPLCSLHVCSITNAAVSSIQKDKIKTAEYFRLRNRILVEAGAQGKFPQ